MRTNLILLASAAALAAQQPSVRSPAPVPRVAGVPQAKAVPQGQEAPAIDFTCPMDSDVRAKGPGKCPRCGMKLEARIQEPVEYRLGFRSTPESLPAGKPVDLHFEFIDPRTGDRAIKFEWVHEKLFHLFLVDAGLDYFAHLHPEVQPDGTFLLKTVLPKPGIYKLVADAYPAGGTPQLLPLFLTTAGYEKSIAESISKLTPGIGPVDTENLHVALRMDPPAPLPGRKTMLFFHVTPTEGLEPYLGAMGHMLAVSSDLVDSIHEHPFLSDKKEIQFNIFFPREGIYRVWVQFQRSGVVNTAQFTIPVKAL